MIPQLSTLRRVVCALAISVVATPAAGAQVSWTDWTSNDANNVFGSMLFNGNPVGVTFSGLFDGAQFGCGTDYWVNPSIYTGVGVPNAPTNCEMIQLTAGSTKTITFSQAVTNPLFALISWNNQPVVTFNGPLEIVNQGCGYWGCGTMTVNGNVLNSVGESHGTIRLLGTYTEVTFTDGTESWHGITVGAEELATAPEPASYVLMATGLLGVFGVSRRKRLR